MKLSFWEIQTWLGNVDFTIVGSGIVGLSCALRLRDQFPHAKILILERGQLPQGASTKNAGFACFGSLSEILEDLNNHSETDVVNLVKQRIDGLRLLRTYLGDDKIDYQEYGGYELFLSQDRETFESCMEQIPYVNTLLKPLFGSDVFTQKPNSFQFNNTLPFYSFNRFEGQIDTGKMMAALLKKAYMADIKILNNCQVFKFSEEASSVIVHTKDFDFKTSNLLIATNGFAQPLTKQAVKPARAQVLITEPIKDLHIKGTFHFDKGYYYFRNINNRILFGGGRNLDFETEETTRFGQTSLVQDRLEYILRHIILPSAAFSIDHRWSGIMGVGPQKKPIIKAIGQRVFCGVRLGGMGVAIGSAIGRELADLVS